MPDADLDFAANHIAAAAYGSAGERCVAISAVVTVGDVADALIALLKKRALEIKVGPGSDASSDMGPVVSAEARDRIVRYIAHGADAGATLVVDGRDCRVDAFPHGFFVGPTLLDNVQNTMKIYTDEVFGPVLCVLRVGTLNEAITLINANPYGNSTALFTGSGSAARIFQRDVEVGMIGINIPVPVPIASYSFGGWKASLFGDHHCHGPESVTFYTRGKVVTSRWPDNEVASSKHAPMEASASL